MKRVEEEQGKKSEKGKWERERIPTLMLSS